MSLEAAKNISKDFDFLSVVSVELYLVVEIKRHLKAFGLDSDDIDRRIQFMGNVFYHIAVQFMTSIDYRFAVGDADEVRCAILDDVINKIVNYNLPDVPVDSKAD